MWDAQDNTMVLSLETPGNAPTSSVPSPACTYSSVVHARYLFCTPGVLNPIALLLYIIIYNNMQNPKKGIWVLHALLLYRYLGSARRACGNADGGVPA